MNSQRIIKYSSSETLKAIQGDLIQSCSMKILRTTYLDDIWYIELRCTDDGFISWLQSFAAAQFDNPIDLCKCNLHIFDMLWIHAVPDVDFGVDVLLFDHEDQEISPKQLKSSDTVECIITWENDQWKLVQLQTHKRHRHRRRI